MILDVFSELQKAQPWPAHHERAVIEEAIAQARLADELGYGCWWNVEHHGAVEFSYSSAPELMPVVLSQHTRRLRFGHSGILAPFRINHPLRIAERAAFLDLVSGGRLELGLARSGGTEWDTFGVDPETSREQLREALQMIPRMWTSEAFAWKSALLEIPERNVVPKPLQKPHPPLWQTCTSPESFSEGPCGAFVNEQVSVVTFVHCAETREAAIASGAGEAALWFVNAAPRVFQVPRAIWIDAIRGDLQADDPAATRSLAQPEESPPDDDLDDPVPVIRLLNRQRAGQVLDPEEVYEVLDAVESVIIGDPERCREKMAGYAGLGVDRLMCLMQFGALPQARILESLRIAGEVLLPHFATEEES
jgi:alkanesulfonate monooxygenase SsuD/methylene tetrahydromethanopterin reductase-like flavin-dependent oxidoreductase (luciferase family)